MHISEGVLTAPVLVSGALLTIIGTSIGLKKLDYDRIPQVAILTSGFFVASFVHAPIVVTSAHLVLNGLMGLFLGWAAFPAIFIAMLLQTLLFQYGGLTSLGINCFNMAFPALICFYLFRGGVKSSKKKISYISAFLCGFVAVFLSCIMLAFTLIFSGEHFLRVAQITIAVHIPVMFIEGVISLFCVRFLKKVKPEVLEVVYES